MSGRLPITGEYPPDWSKINAAVCEVVGHRCIRCGHPYRKGEHGNGEWSRCDEQCAHLGPVQIASHYGLLCIDGNQYSSGWEPGRTYAAWRILTVHHLDGNKANCSWWNLLALCQRCHLTVQGSVKPETPWFLEHSEWFRPYVAGFYAKKYEDKEITREEAVARMDELLAHERLA